jgi:hypothetical protein
MGEIVPVGSDVSDLSVLEKVFGQGGILPEVLRTGFKSMLFLTLISW